MYPVAIDSPRRPPIRVVVEPVVGTMVTGNQVFVAVIALGVLGGGGTVLAGRMPSCENRDLVRDLVAHIRHDENVEGLMVSGVETLHGFLFGRRECRALVRELRGNVDLTTHPWTQVEYSDPPSTPLYKVTGSAMPPLLED